MRRFLECSKQLAKIIMPIGGDGKADSAVSLTPSRNLQKVTSLV
jgi:hypothetical protein